MRILAISGSLRAASSNTRLIEALAALAPEGMEIVVFGGIHALPYFNPDLDHDTPPPPVLDLRRQIEASDGLVICSPEYAHGVAGVMKNALDWLVSSVEFPQTITALINASPRAEHAQAHLREILTVMSARLVEEACVSVPLQGRDLTTDQIVEDAELASRLRDALVALARSIRQSAGAE
jgi:NAD(P)H-dependent FMN reductase